MRKHSGCTGRGAFQVSGMKLNRVLCVLSWVVLMGVVTEATLPIPAPDIPNQCNSIERCCMPTPYTGAPGIRQFEFEAEQPWRVRRPAHLLSKFELERLERAYALLRALPDSDPRSLWNQKNLHCLYCDNALYYPGQQYPLEIHNGWYFLPWHRMFMYWHERILAKVLNDSTFALPFWAWDNQQDDTNPPGNVMPPQYTNPNSSLYDPIRNNCSNANPYIDLDNRGGICTNKTASYMRTQNDRLLYTQLVIGAPTPALFYGLPYYFGDYGGRGPGTFEDSPHGPVHAWVGDPYAPPPYSPLDDMGRFRRSAFDPVFYAHHSNIDRVWWLWTRIPGGTRTFPMAPAYNLTQFTFYDEDANLVKMNVSQVLDSDLLRYKYEALPTPWVTNGVEPGKENSIPLCNPLSKSEVYALIRETNKHKSRDELNVTVPLTFRVKRPSRSSQGTEVLELSGIRIPNATDQMDWKVYFFYPQAQVNSTGWCPEYAGTLNLIPHDGQASYNPLRVWRVAVGPKLQQIGKDYVKSVVVTVVQTTAPPGQNVTFNKAKIFYDLSPSVTL
jgi:polyphenol oxidase